MNPEARKTAALAGTAALLLLITILTGARPKEAEVFTQQGKPFYPDFVDPLKATALEILEIDEATASAKPFRVEFANGKWTIPSHSSYPADAKERLAKTAGSVIDLKKDQIASTSEKDWESLGVVDPLEAKGAPKGTGRRVKFFMGTQVAADYIFGKDAGDGKKYVRVPGDKRTYVSKTPGEISSKFEDWVETDLLDVSAGAIRRIVIDKYSLDETTGDLKDRSVNTLARDDSAKPWTLNELKDVEEVHGDNVGAMTSALDDLKIAGVRPKPPLIAKAKDLSNLGTFTGPQLQALAQELGSKGFFVVYADRSRKTLAVLCNEGEMTVSCDDGVVYTLRFGEVLFGSGEDITAGGPKKDEKKDDKKDEKKGGTENRYLFVSARFDESLLPAPPLEPLAYVADPAKKPEEQKAEEEKAKAAKTEWESKKKERDAKVEAGKKRAEKLANRFGEWYYVISADAFKKLRLDRPSLVKPKEKKPDEKKDEKHDDKDGHKHDGKKPEGAKPEEKKPAESPKGDEKKPDAPKADEKKPDAPKPAETPKAEEKKP
jgi:hypothetical protein